MLWISTHFTLQKTQHLVVSPNLHLGRNGVILCMHKAKQHRNTNPLSAACIHQPRWCVPCQVNNAQLKPGRWETAVKRVVCTTDEPTACTAQRTYHSTVHRKRVPKSRVAYEGQVETQVYWCTLKIEHRAARIQLHHRVTVVLPAPAV